MNKKSLFKNKNTVTTVYRLVTTGLVAFFVMGWLSTAVADPTSLDPTLHSQLKRMHDRLIGVPPTTDDLNKMEIAFAGAGGGLAGANAAALEAINNSSRNKEFYNTTLKNFFVKYTNLENSPLEPLNDAAATMIGMVRDNTPFDQILYGNYLYSWSGSAIAGSTLPAYSRTDNGHYVTLDEDRYDLSDVANFTNTGQTGATSPVQSVSGTPTPAGVLTTRAWGETYYSNGTNRRILEFSVGKFMCRKLEELKDTTRVPDRVRQDVSRSPGGDSSLFLNQCVGCHAGMDPLVAAFSYYEWAETAVDSGVFGLVYDNQIKHDPNATVPVKHKYLINSGSFPQGYVTVDDGWENYWREGKNAELGWGQVQLSAPSAQPPAVPASTAGNKAAGYTNSGNGPTTYGEEFASSTAFAECQVNRVYRHVCLQEPTTGHQAGLNTIRANFISGATFDMKQVFAETAALCMGQ